MTTATMMGAIGQTGRLTTDGLEVEVQVLDVRVSYGAMQFEISPTAGAGRKWVAAERVRGITMTQEPK